MAENTLQRAADAPAAETETAVTVTPRVDILEREDELLLVADFPGVRPEDVELRYEQGELHLHGRRKPAFAGKPALHSEGEATHYHRAFRVSENVAADRIAADLQNGVLTVRLPKVEAVKPRKIAVTGA